MKLHRRVLAVLIAALLLVAAGVQTAEAAYPPGGPTLTISASVVVEGTPFTVRGTGFKAHAKVAVVMHSNNLTLGTPTSDATGSFALPATVPCNFPIGFHTITGDDGSGSASTSVTLKPCATTDATVVASATPGVTEHTNSGSGTGVNSGSGGLPFTGVVIAWLLVLAAIALLVGSRLVQVSRRRSAR